MANRLDRRAFLKKAGGTALGATALTLAGSKLADAAGAEERVSFRSNWAHAGARPWAGADYWANPMQDWRLHDGRLECFSPGGDRNVALLTRDVADRSGTLSLSVRLGKIGPGALERGFVGFGIGNRFETDDYRAIAIYGQGMNAGISADGRLFIGSLEDSASSTSSAPRIDLGQEIHLQLHARPSAGGYTVTLRATSSAKGHAVETTRELPADSLTGGLALVCSSAPMNPAPEAASAARQLPAHDFAFYPPQQQRGGTMRFWFSDWTVGGSKVDEHPDRAFGPILFTLYTVSRGTLKLSAQFPPLGDAAGNATLQVRAASSGGAWNTVATALIDTDAWNATFRVPAWDASKEWSYRVVYSMAADTGAAKQHTYAGSVRKDPVDKPQVVVGLLTCIWDLGFPHTDFTTHLAAHKPEILFWTGDQVYEPVGGFGVIESRNPAMLETAMLDFTRKWLIFGWAVGGLTRDIPSVCMTDDHDMYHGNIWGCGGRPTNPALGEQGYAGQDSGGYKMPPRWVNMVQRMQTAHLPDPFDATPVLQGISVYYTDLRWGGVSFAILEDRKWKSAPKQQLPGADIQNGFALNPAWNTPVQSNVDDAELLGQRQLDFLESWAADWGGGTWMKFAVSQTLFGCLHTEPAGANTDQLDPREPIPPVGAYIAGDHVVADHDSAGWPQQGRDAAILKWRKGFAAHLSGDQHLGTTVHYGVDEFRDGVYSVCTPAISNCFPRRWFPPIAAANGLPGLPYTGDHLDGFGNKMTVLAVANPAQYEGPGLEGLRFRVTGYSILTCDRATRKTTIAQWPRWVDPTAAGAAPYQGWPITVDQLDNGLNGAKWTLGSIETTGFRDAVIQVQDAVGEVVYTVRANGESFAPLVRKPGAYAVLAFDPDGYYRKEWKKVQARALKTE